MISDSFFFRLDLPHLAQHQIRHPSSKSLSHLPSAMLEKDLKCHVIKGKCIKMKGNEKEMKRQVHRPKKLKKKKNKKKEHLIPD